MLILYTNFVNNSFNEIWNWLQVNATDKLHNFAINNNSNLIFHKLRIT